MIIVAYNFNHSNRRRRKEEDIEDKKPCKYCDTLVPIAGTGICEKCWDDRLKRTLDGEKGLL